MRNGPKVGGVGGSAAGRGRQVIGGVEAVGRGAFGKNSGRVTCFMFFGQCWRYLEGSRKSQLMSRASSPEELRRSREGSGRRFTEEFKAEAGQHASWMVIGRRQQIDSHAAGVAGLCGADGGPCAGGLHGRRELPRRIARFGSEAKFPPSANELEFSDEPVVVAVQSRFRAINCSTRAAIPRSWQVSFSAMSVRASERTVTPRRAAGCAAADGGLTPGGLHLVVESFRVGSRLRLGGEVLPWRNELTL